MRLSISPLACILFLFLLFFFNDPATTEIYTLSLHDALPISRSVASRIQLWLTHLRLPTASWFVCRTCPARDRRSEEHTSELQSPDHLVCRLLLEKKKKKKQSTNHTRCTT